MRAGRGGTACTSHERVWRHRVKPALGVFVAHIKEIIVRFALAVFAPPEQEKHERGNECYASNGADNCARNRAARDAQRFLGGIGVL